MSTTQEVRARKKQSDAIKCEQERKYKKAGYFYSIANVIWKRVSNSKSNQTFCNSRKKICDAMAIKFNDTDDDDELI